MQSQYFMSRMRLLLLFESNLNTINDINELKKMLEDNKKELVLTENMGYDKIAEFCKDKIFLIKQRIKMYE